MGYTLDLECLSIQEYKELLKQQNLLPSRKILLNNIDDNFLLFKKRDINTVGQLKKSFSTPTRMANVVANTGITEEYLIILNREVSSLVQKPVLLSSFPNSDIKLLENLSAVGIKNSKDYWELKQDPSDDLFCLCDLVRINGIGPVAARAFFEAGYKSINDVAAADAANMLARVTIVNEIKCYYKAKLGQKDMQFCIDFALLLQRYSV
jgi:hypothetical protein